METKTATTFNPCDDCPKDGNTCPVCTLENAVAAGFENRARISQLEAQLREREIEAAECKRWKARAESAERLRHEVAHPFDAEEVLGAYKRGARDALRWEQLSVRGGNPAHKSAADVAGDTVLARFLASRGTTENKGEEG